MQQGHMVIMAKPAVAGRVKTRLTGRLTAPQAAEVHRAMWGCVMARVARLSPVGWSLRLVVALDGADAMSPEAAREALPAEDASAWSVMDQGSGDLGARLAHVWRELGGGPVMFLGVDSPDVPFEAINEAWAALTQVDVAVGPVEDGGYWTLASRAASPCLLKGIDWGTSSVYHQTLAAAAEAGFTTHRLLPWHDVDDWHDLRSLRARLATVEDPDLLTLRDRLTFICKDDLQGCA